MGLVLAILPVPNFSAYAVSPNPTPDCSAISTCTITFSYTGDIYEWNVPAGITQATFDVRGAEGGASVGYLSSSGKGARIGATLSVTAGQTLKILVGGKGQTQRANAGGGGGGGGSFVSTLANVPLVIAGGGGGAGGRDSQNGRNGSTFTSGTLDSTGQGTGGSSGSGGTAGTGSWPGGGGGGFNSGGTSGTGSAVGGSAFTAGGSGGVAPNNAYPADGGYGGGGAVGFAGGGGGGYSGGAGGIGIEPYPGGGGGGSFVASGSSAVRTSDGQYSGSATFNGQTITNINAFNSGNGIVTITYLNSPTPTTFSTSQANPTNASTAATISYSLVLSQSVSDLAAGDFQFAGGGASCNTPIVTGSGTTYTITVTNCSEGLLTLQLKANSVTGTSTGPPAVSSANSITIDRTAPTVSSVTAPSNGTYSPTGNPTGSALAFSVRMDESVTVTTSGGTPSLEVTIGSTTRSATYISQSDSRTLTFRYLIASSTSDIDTDGIALSSTLSLNGGVIADLAGNALTNTSLTATQALPSLTNILVAQRATAPTITSIDAGNTQLSINFTAGANNGSAITNYKYSLNSGSFTAFSPVDTTTPLVISGLANGTSYAVRILAMTGVGDGESSTSVTATPTAIVVGGGSNITTSFGRIETSTAFTASGGTSPYTFSLSPTVSGISINTSTGVVTTSSTLATGTYSTNVIATDSGSRSGQKPITVTVGKASPTFSSWSNVTKTFGDSPYTITAPTVTGSIAGSFTYTSSNPAVISINTSTATVVAAGTATISALFTPSDTSNYETATTTNTVTVNKATQTITFASLTDKTLGMGTFTISATSSSGLTVSFISVDTTRCTIATATVTLLAAGTCTISASQAGDSNYDSATVVTRSFTISPTLNITTPNSGLSGSYNAVFTLTLSISGGSGGATFSLASGTLPSGLSLNGSSGVISGTAASAGSRTITIQVSDSNGATATTSAFTITISQLTPTVSLALTGGVTSTPIGVAITITATVSQPGSVAFKVAGSTISGCSAVASSAGNATCSWTPASLGNASLTAELSPTDSTNYSSATSSTLTITVVTASTTITLSVTGGAITKGASRSIVASTTDVAGKVTFRINGRVIRGCVNRSVASAQATCIWRVALHGSQTVSATFNPTNIAYQNSTASLNVVALRRSGTRS